mgnify:CR=1 FL=1
MERPHRLRLERTHDRMQNSPVVEQHQVLRAPIMRVHKLWRDGGPLHLVEQLPHLLDIGEVRAIGVQSAFAVSTLGERSDDELVYTAGVHLEVEVAGDGVLPELSTGASVQALSRRAKVGRNSQPGEP